MVKKKENNTWGLWSLILGIASIVFCWFSLLGIISGILAIVFSIKQEKISKNRNAKVGKITGIIGLILSIIYLTVMVTILLLGSVVSTGVSP